MEYDEKYEEELKELEMELKSYNFSDDNIISCRVMISIKYVDYFNYDYLKNDFENSQNGILKAIKYIRKLLDDNYEYYDNYKQLPSYVDFNISDDTEVWEYYDNNISFSVGFSDSKSFNDVLYDIDVLDYCEDEKYQTFVDEQLELLESVILIYGKESEESL